MSKRVDFLAERSDYADQRTGVMVESLHWIIWADAGCLEIIRAVDGVNSAYNNGGGCQYDLFLDPRYDAEAVIANVEAAVLCRP